MISKSKNAVGATNVETSNLNHQQIKANLLGREIEPVCPKPKPNMGGFTISRLKPRCSKVMH